MPHAHNMVESWDDDEDSFALPSDDPNPLRVTSVTSTAFADREDEGAFSDEDDFGFDLPERTDWTRLGQSKVESGLDRWMEDQNEEEEGNRSSTIRASSGGTLKLPESSSGMRTITSLDQVASLNLPVPTMTGPDLSNKLTSVSLARSFVLPSELETEDDFALPETLSNLSLRPLRTQNSSASFTSSTSTNAQNASWGDTPSSAHSVPSLIRSGSEAATSSDVNEQDFRDDTFETEEFGLDGIVLPDPLFFTRSNSTLYLKTLLEAKSKGNNASSSNHSKAASAPVDTARIASGRDTSTSAAEDFESGLVLEDDSHLLSTARLRSVKARTARARTLPLPKGARPKPASGAATTLPAVKSEDDWKKDLERGWGRSKSPFGSLSSTASGRRSRTPVDNMASIGKGRPPIPNRSSAPSKSTLAPSTSPTASLRRERSHAHLTFSPSASSPPAVPSPSSSPVHMRYPGSYAQGLLNRKASLPHLSIDSSDESHPSSPGGGLGRFAAPTASSLARQRDRSSILNQDVYSPPSSSTARSTTPQLTFSPSSTTVIGTRLTMPTSTTRSRTRPPITQSLFTHRPTPSSSSSTGASPRTLTMQTRPRGIGRKFGDGTELDDLDDLSVDAEKERQFRVPDKKDVSRRVKDLKTFPLSPSLQPRTSSPIAFVSSPSSRQRSTLTASTASFDMKRKKALSSTSTSSAALAAEGVQRKAKKRPALIKNPGGAGQVKVEGKMRYNPTTCKWEGNESALQAFEPASASTRPALITHLTGNSISSLGGTSGPHSPTERVSARGPAAAAISVKVVGHMQFDPVGMRWISLLGKDEEEPDPFADLDDDLDEDVDMDDLDAGVGKSSISRSGRPPSRSSRARRDPSVVSSVDFHFDGPLLAPERPPASLSEYIRRGPDEFELARKCRQAEEGHRAEIAQWALGTTGAGEKGRELESGRLWEIRKVALRAGKEGETASMTRKERSRHRARPQ